jgi:two-component system chemotaxis response regulator CheB
VVVFSTLTERGATATLEALARGASDYVCKPSGQKSIQATMERIRAELIPKIHALHSRNLPGGAKPMSPANLPKPQARGVMAPVQLIVIGVSTGGPTALAEIIPRLPKEMLQPVLIVQHMPAVFTRVLAQRLNASSPLEVREAVHQDQLKAGHVYVAPGDHHMRVAGSPRAAWLALDQSPAENGCRPAADPLFQSAAQIFGSSVLALVLTGLGHDGTKGAALVRRAGGEVWVQDEASSTVWGMPGSIVQAGHATRVLPLSSIARALAELGRGGVQPAASSAKPQGKP